MKITENRITIRDLTQDYADDGEGGVTGYSGDLDIRPPYQREFVYKDKQRAVVIDTVRRDLPLNVMYWAKRDPDPNAPDQPSYEIMDGQQRTISVAQYVRGDFSVDGLYFHSLTQDQQDAFLDYELLVYICEGTESDKLDWFKTINIAGESLTDQELRNAVYAGPWLTDAKRHFSQTGGPASQLSDGYVKGVAIRQELLETALKWLLARDSGKYSSIEQVMSDRQHWKNAGDTWGYFQQVINWARSTFPIERTFMTQVDWERLYREHGKRNDLDSNELEDRIKLLVQDEDVTSKAGIYSYVLDGRERRLSIRTFTAKQKQEAYERQDGKCAACDEEFTLAKLQGDHIVPWSKGGRTVSENLKLLCQPCNTDKSDT